MATTQTYTLSNKFTQIFRRQQDDLPEHVKVNVYFDDQGPGHPNTGYYLDTPRKQHTPIEFIEANDTYYWVKLLFRQDKWQTNQRGIYNGSDIGWWIISDPQHPNHIFYKQEASVPLTIAAVTTALQQLPTCPNTPDYPTAMEGQQEEINVATGQAQQEAQRINVINTSNGALKGNPPPIFDGDRNKTTKFLLSWDLWQAVNRANDTMKKPYSRIITMLSYMDGTCIDAWKGEQLLKLQEAINDGTPETDEDLWTDFIERFKNAFVNQNRRSKAYQELCKLKQGDSLDDFFTKFKQLAHKADVPLDDKGTIETLKHAMTQGLTSAIINSPTFDPTTKTPWTFKEWEEQARKSHLKWKAAAKFTQRCQGLFQAFKLAPKQNNNSGRGSYGRNNNYRRRTTSQGGYHMDVDATVTSDINATAGRGQQHSEAKKAELMRSNLCFYCEIKGNQDKDCRKKQSDHRNFSGRPKEPTRACTTLTAPDFQDLDSVAGFLKENMDSFDEDTKLDFIGKLMPKDFPEA